MIFNTVQIQKQSRTKNGQELNDEFGSTRDWEDVMMRCSFRMKDINFIREYAGEGGNEVSYFKIDNSELCRVDLDSGDSLIIVESYDKMHKLYNDFYKPLQTKENGSGN